jgi:hypothetical protein
MRGYAGYLNTIPNILATSCQLSTFLPAQLPVLPIMEGDFTSKITPHQETWHSNNRTNRDGIVMSSDYSGLTRLTDYSVAIV